MKIQSKDVTVEQLQEGAIALGLHLGYTDNQRNARPATMAEIDAFCFGPFKTIWQNYKRQRAIDAANVDVPAVDL